MGKDIFCFTIILKKESNMRILEFRTLARKLVKFRYCTIKTENEKQVSCLGFRGDAPRYQDNSYNNLFSNETALFETSEGGMSRINVFWGAEGAHGETGRLFGELGRFDMNVLHIGIGIQAKYEGIGDRDEIEYPDNRPSLPEGMELGGHGGSHGYLTNEFIMALVENREPLIDVYEGIAMTAPGIVAHQSALNNGERLLIPDFDIR